MSKAPMPLGSWVVYYEGFKGILNTETKINTTDSTGLLTEQ